MKIVKTAILLILCTPTFGAENTSPLIVELFTSQGCSSCPPADNLLGFLREKYRSAILPLAFHVDYWDKGGWQDSFSSAEATQHQRTYRKAFGDPDLYTPEMVIQGEVGFIGSDRLHAEKEIRSRLGAVRPAFDLTVLSSPQRTVSFSLPKEIALPSRTISVVLFENAPPVQVTRGENARQLLSGDFAVRKIITLSNVSGSDFTVPIELEAGWVASKTGVAVLVHGGNQRILAAQSRYPLE